jgi:DNA-binding transcriptional LysR family regulator
MDWNDVRYFLALARLGSVRGAGASLGVSHSTVARRVEALEARLAARLFDRNRDGYTLTEAGRQMLPGAERVEREMAALERGLVGQDERLAGMVSLTCCDQYVSGMLIADLVPFCAQHAEIELRVTSDSRPFDLSKREADIAVRALGIGVSPPEHLIGVRLVPVVIASFVAAAHAERLDPGHGGASTRWLCFDDSKIVDAMIAGSSFPTLPRWGAFPSLPLMVQAIRAGLGICMLPTYVGDTEPSLQRLSAPDLRHVGDLWLLSHADLRDNARFRAVRARVTESLRRRTPLFRGERGPQAATALAVKGGRVAVPASTPS